MTTTNHRLLTTNHLKLLVAIFFAWRIWLFVFLFLAVLFIPLRFQFLGGGLGHYLEVPWFWAWSNFDGEHYLSIAQHGYGEGEQAFFPLYPLLMRLLGWPWRGNLTALNISGLIISHVSLLATLAGLAKLVSLDFKKDIAQLSLLFLLVFPTSFYLGSTYTESLFLALVVWSFYFARKGKWWIAGILGALASATRFVGILLLPALLWEWWVQRKTTNRKLQLTSLVFLSLIPVGLLAYMLWLQQTTGNPLAFWTALPGFGEQRSAIPILLPQVFFRYAKIMLTATWNDPIYFAIVMELVVAILFLVLSIWSFFKLRLSYALFLALGTLLPTFSGSFSSLSRYVLVLFPGFLLLALWLSKKTMWVKLAVFAFLAVLLLVSTAIFVRGYWIA